MRNLVAINRTSSPARVAPRHLRIAFTHNLQTAKVEVQAEFDSVETVRKIADSLRSLGHEVFLVEVAGPVSRLVERLTLLAPDLIFNTAQGARGRCREAFYPALFEQLGIPFTGSDAHACTITLDKNLTKHVVASHGVRTPASILVESLPDLVGHRLRFPVMIKPNFEGSSVGITEASIVETQKELRERTRQLLSCYPAGLLAEEYIEGIDVVVPFLQGASPSTAGVLEPASYSYRRDTQRQYNIYDFDRKMSAFGDLVVEIPAEMSLDAREQAIDTSRVVVEVLRIRDLARIDYRLGSDGRLYFLEIDALPSLDAGSCVYAAAALVGVSGADRVMAAVLDSACQRYGISEPSCLHQSKRPHARCIERRPTPLTA